jgi:hypothetical protein
MRLVSKIDSVIMNSDYSISIIKKGENYYCEETANHIKVYDTYLIYTFIKKEAKYKVFYTNAELRKLKLEKINESRR